MPDSAVYAVISILAIIIAPVLAVQSSLWLEKRKEEVAKKVWIFKTLMATRATRLHPDHVQALNLIDLEFGTPRKKAFKPVIDAWKSYHDHLGSLSSVASQESWEKESEHLLVSLLLCMSKSLGYDFNEVDIKRGVYYPRGHGDIESQLTQIRTEMCKILQGQKGFPVWAVVTEAKKPPNQTDISQDTTKKDA